MLELIGKNGHERVIQNFKEVSLIITTKELNTKLPQVLMSLETEPIKIVNYVMKHTKRNETVIVYTEFPSFVKKLKEIIEIFDKERFVIFMHR